MRVELGEARQSPCGKAQHQAASRSTQGKSRAKTSGCISAFLRADLEDTDIQAVAATVAVTVAANAPSEQAAAFVCHQVKQPSTYGRVALRPLFNITLGAHSDLWV